MKCNQSPMTSDYPLMSCYSFALLSKCYIFDALVIFNPKFNNLVMKKFLCMLLLGSIITVVVAQSNNIVNVKMKETKCLQDDYQSVNPAPFKQTHLYLKNQLQNNMPRGGARNVTSVEIGSSGNLFTILSSEVNRIATNGDLNTVVFVHRSDPSIFPLSNVGQYRYDVSYDGGATWTLNQGVLNPKGNQQTRAGRYPNTAIYNPTGNTDPDSAYMLYLGSWLPFDAGGSWDGHFSGVARLDNDTLTYTENISTPNNGDISIVGGLCNGTQGTFWAVNWENTNDLAPNFTSFIIFKGVWNPNRNDVDWVEYLKVSPDYDLDFDGTIQATSLNMSFDPTGQYGFVSFLGDVVSGGDNVLSPVLYKTTDGGDNWTGPIVLDLSTFNNVVNNLSVNPTPQPAFDMDIVVDGNGSPHMLVVIGSSGQDYAISTGTGAGLKIYDITYVPTGANDCKWQAIFIDDVATLRGDITADVTEDNRPQCSLSPDGQKVFFGWLDSDATVTGGSNELPNLKTRALDVNTGLAAPVVNRTDTDPIWAGGALFASFSPVAQHNGNTYRVPTVFTQLNASGSDAEPTSFHYVQDIQYMESEFTIDVFPPVIVLNATSPITVVVNTPYVDPGATANDNLDGDITANIVANISAVNTAAVGSYLVTYNVTDATGNAACDATRIVNVVATPDNTPPTILLTGTSTINIDVCSFFSDPGATANDNVDGDITNNITVTSTVPGPLVPGSYTIDYDVTDGAGNVATTVSRTVNVSDLPPAITLNGDNPLNIEICQNFADPGAFAVDNCAGALSLTVVSTVDTNTVGSYTITYTATDGVNAPVSSVRTVNITADITAPSLIALGANPFYVYLGENFTDPGAASVDCVDGNLTGDVVSNASSVVNVSARGNYTVIYTVSDAAGNAATPATRVVVVNTEPDPDFTYVVSGGTVAYTDESLYNPTGWQWDFGDQFASVQPNPSRTYIANGTYTVCLKASNVYNSTPFSKPIKETCKDVVVDAVGINDVAIGNSFDIFPNPTSGLLTLEIKTSDFEKVRIELFDIVGKSLKAFEINERTAGSRHTLDFSGNSEGVYLVKIQTEKGTATKKIIVSR